MINKINYMQTKSPTKAECEDAIILNKNKQIFGVLDGATPLTDFKDTDGHNGAYLAANLFKEYFERWDKEISLTDAIIEANAQLRKKMIANQVDMTRKHELWSTCVAVIKVQGNQMHYAQLGDSLILVKTKENTTNILTKDTVEGVTQRAKEQRSRERANGVPLPDEHYYQDILRTLIYNRQMANTPNGYSVANGMLEVADYIQFGTVDLTTLTDILIISDGLFHPKKDLHYTMRTISERGLETYIENLTNYEQDHQLKMDDKTAIWIQLKD